MMSRHKDFVHTDVPQGDKFNCHLLVDNTRNITRAEQNRNCEFVDDCGVWNRAKSNTVKSTFIIDKKTVWTTQPERNTVIIFSRYYTTLNSGSKFHKRVTYISNSGNPNVGSVDLFEYSKQQVDTRQQET